MESRRSSPCAQARELASYLCAIQSKDRPAFERFYDATVDRVLGLAQRITQHPQLAEEVVGDVYLQVWRQSERFDAARGTAMAWLMNICRSRALDALRRASAGMRRAQVPLADGEEPSSPQTTQDLLISADRNSALYRALEQLGSDQRQLLSLAYFRGYTHRELAAFTGLPVGTVKTQIRRSLQKMRALLPDARDMLPRAVNDSD